jgi:hypothetical protein
VVRILDSYASLLVLLLANVLLLELVEDRRWGAIGSTLLAAAALVVAISDPSAGARVTHRQTVLIVACVGLSFLVLLTDSAEVVGLVYLLPVAMLVTATLPITLSRVIRHRRVTSETVLGALCCYVLFGLMFAFVYLAVADLRDGTFFAQGGTHAQSEYVYFSFVTLTTLGFGDLSPAVGLPQALVIFEALLGQVSSSRSSHGSSRSGSARAPTSAPNAPTQGSPPTASCSARPSPSPIPGAPSPRRAACFPARAPSGRRSRRPGARRPRRRAERSGPRGRAGRAVR